MRRSERILVRLCLLLLMSFVGCSRPNVYVEPPPPEVSVVHPIERSVTEYLEFTGMTQPLETVDIRARVKGILRERHFTDGAEVTQGQLLLVIDEEPFRIQLEAARSRLREAEAALQQATVSRAREVAKAQVSLKQAEVALAEQEEIRVRGLFESKAVSQSEMDQARARRESRVAELDSARASLAQADATYDTTIQTFKAQVDSAAIAVRDAELNLSYCRMTAPIDGRITRINIDVGNLINDNGSAILATIIKLKPIHAYATVSESDLQRTPALRDVASRGNDQSVTPLPVELGLPSDNGYPRRGVVDYTDPALDSSTGTMGVRGLFENSDHSLIPGMFVRMRLAIAEHSGSLLVPERALGTDQSGQYLYVVNSEGVVQYRSVKTGVQEGDLRVVTGELSTTDQVILEGLLRVRPGARVVARPGGASPTSSFPAGSLEASGSKAAVSEPPVTKANGPEPSAPEPLATGSPTSPEAKK